MTAVAQRATVYSPRALKGLKGRHYNYRSRPQLSVATSPPQHESQKTDMRDGRVERIFTHRFQWIRGD
jgi:hypothetical protein